jgi:drug/metabolite transporter (DMT)-like permease
MIAEKKQRTNTGDSLSSSPRDAVAGLDPLIQPIHDQDGPPVYVRRRSSIFYLPNISTDDEMNKSIDENEPETILRRCLTYAERFSGILYALSASLLFTCSNFALKQLDIVLFDVLIIRFLVQGLMSLTFIVYKGYQPWSHGNELLICLRSLFAAGGSISYYSALTRLPLSDLTTVRYTQVVWTAVLVLIIFRERINLPTIIASVLTLIGVVCVAQPSFLFTQSSIYNQTQTSSLSIVDKNQRLVGMILALACALSISMSIILNKKLIQRKVRQSIIMFHFLLITLLSFVLFQIYHWLISTKKPAHLHWKQVLLTKDYLLASIIAVLQIFPLVLSQKSIKREHPSIVTVVQSSDIVFAIILQNVFTSIRSNLLILLGSALVLTSIFIVGGHKLWNDRQNRTCLPTCS